MQESQWEQVKELFAEVMAIPPAQRDEFLAGACGDDQVVKSRVAALLKAHARADAFLGDPTHPDLSGGSETSSPSLATGTAIGPYAVVKLIGEGGFGSVYLATQQTPVSRQVALKIIKRGMDTRQVIARFEAERQALAMMDHPNIARVLEAGTTSDGRPYFAMEVVDGVPITRYCDEHHMTIAQRLELFTTVCHAVQHAHHKGIIHRDLKPSNVLVALGDDSPIPKVIDFGIAKATSDEVRLTGRTLITDMRQLIGTPEYMSPEQATMGQSDVDTRADIYALGVLLYELLTGTTPLESSRLRSAAFGEVQRLIREEDPQKPSTRVRTLMASAAMQGRSPGLAQNELTDAATVAVQRRSDPARLTRELNGDLDWIVMKALEKDRTRRYGTAAELAADVQRYLSHEPVLAGPPSTIYRMRKFARRNLGAVAAAAAVGVVILLALIVSLFFGISETRQRRIAEQNEQAATIAMARAEVEARRAQDEAERAEREAQRATRAEAEAKRRADELQMVAEFQTSQLEGIQTEFMGARIRQSLIDKRRAFLEGLGFDEETIAANLRELDQSLTGINFTNVALDTLHENIFERALKAIDAQFADKPLIKVQLLNTMALTLRELGLPERAMGPQSEILEILRQIECDHCPGTLMAGINLGILLLNQGKLGEAEPYLRKGVTLARRVLGDDHPDTLFAMGSLASLLRAQGKLAEAERYHRQALEHSRRLLGEEHPETLTRIGNLGSLLRDQGKLAEAETYLREALEFRRRLWGDDHPGTLTSINNLALLLAEQGKLAEAETYLRLSLDGLLRVVGETHPNTLSTINNLGAILKAQDKFVEAEPYLREALESRRRLLGEEHPDTLNSIYNLANLFSDQRRLAEAESYLREATELSRRVLGEEHPSTLMKIDSLGRLLRELERLQEADTLGAEAVAGARRVLPAGHWHTAAYLRTHSGTLAQMRRFVEAEEQLLEAQQIFEATFGPQHRRTIGNIKALVKLYEAWHEAEPAAGHLQKAAQWRALLTKPEPDQSAPVASE